MDKKDTSICTWCRALGTEHNQMIVSPHCDAYICMSCATDAVVTLHRETRADIAPLLRALSGDAAISFAEKQLREEVAEELRERFQRELLELRDPDEVSPNEEERCNITTKVTRYTYDRVTALANEAGINVSAWIRQAIFHAFKLTSHKQT